MHFVGYLFIGFGALLTIVGIALFAKMGTQGTSAVRMMGFEFQLGGSALVIFVVGVALTMVPVVYGDRFFTKTSSGQASGGHPGIVGDSLDPVARPARFVVLDIAGGIQFGESLFVSRPNCLSRVTELGYPAAKECVRAPAQVWCSRVGSRGWDCYVTEGECRTSTAADDVIFGRPGSTITCVRTSFAQARERALVR